MATAQRRRRRRRGRRRRQRARIRLLLLAVILIVAAIFGSILYRPVKYLKQGTKQLQAQEYEEAERLFQAAIDKKSGMAEAYRGLGMARWELEDYSGAETAFLKALENGAEETGSLYNLLSVCQMKQGKYEAALSRLQNGLECENNSEELIREMRYNLIVCYEKVQDWDGARKAAEDYVKDYPDDERVAKEAEFFATQ